MFNKFKNSNDVYIIAEVGQNHQGSVNVAIEYIREFSRIGANAIKFQVRDNKTLFSKEKYNSIYNSENAFGETYGQHREALELSKKDLVLLKKECKKHNVDFMATAFDEKSLNLLLDIKVDVLKIASFDLGNLKLIKSFAKSRKPTVLSIGGGKINHLIPTVKLMKKYTNDFAILHCVSEYPCPVERLGLNNIEKLIKKFPEQVIGLSDHFNGVLSGPIAYMFGARVFEKHVTLNRSWKGTDHPFALEAKGFSDFVRDIKRVPLMMNLKPEKELGKEYVFKKLGKSIYFDKDLKRGQIIRIDDLKGIIDDDINGIPIRETYRFVGKKIIKNVKKNEKLLIKYFKK